MAERAPVITGEGTPVSQTPWARLTPLMRSHSTDMARISDWTIPGEISLRRSLSVVALIGFLGYKGQGTRDKVGVRTQSMGLGLGWMRRGGG